MSDEPELAAGVHKSTSASLRVLSCSSVLEHYFHAIIYNMMNNILANVKKYEVISFSSYPVGFLETKTWHWSNTLNLLILIFWFCLFLLFSFLLFFLGFIVNRIFNL